MIAARRLALLCCGFGLFHIVPIQGQRVAQRKCQEYIDRNSETFYYGDLSLDPDVIKVQTVNCTSSVDLIINGVEAQIGEFPHQALLARPNETNPAVMDYYCGGSLISEWFVLTAAHCYQPTIVYLGEHNLTDIGKSKNISVSNYFRHPNYRLSQHYFDIALVLLSAEVKFNQAIRPACLWTSDSLNFSTVVATGFGATEKGPNSTVLMKVQLRVMDKEICDDKFFGHWKLDHGVNDGQMCVGSLEGGTDTCNGDSGGPIQIVTNPDTCTYYVVGITCMGHYKCGIGMSEALHTKVASYVDWIEQMVWPND